MKKSVKILIVVLFLIIAGLVTFIVVDKSILTKRDEKSINEENNTIIAENSNKSEGNIILKEDNNNNSAGSNTNTIKKSETDEANEAIRKALKDETWIENNIISDEDKEQGIQAKNLARETICFAKLKSNTPMYIITCGVNWDQGKELSLITYENENVIVRHLLNKEYSSYEVDLNKNIIAVIPSVAGGSYYEIKDNKAVMFADIEGEVDYDEKYYYKNEECTKGEFEKKINMYDFKEITTKLTKENVYKYVK